MIRKFKALGLALVAVFAMSAVVASAAQATPGELTVFGSESSGVVASGSQVGEHEFTFTSHPVSGGFANFKCKTATFTGTPPNQAGDTTLFLYPHYTSCTAFGQPATITSTGCHIELHIGTPTASGWHVTKTIVCSAGSVIKIVTGTCEVQVGSQGPLSTGEVTNDGGPGVEMDLLLHTDIEGITYTVTKDNIGCPLSGTGVDSDGDWVGTTTVIGIDADTWEQIGITIS